MAAAAKARPDLVEPVDGTQIMTRITGDPYTNVDVRNRAEMKDRAYEAVDQVAAWEITDKGKSDIAGRLARDHGHVARLILATGSDAYKRAFTKAMTGQEALYTPEERDAVSRAMSLTDAEGGFAVPFPIDPTLIITGDGTTNPVRSIARIENITSDSWQGVSAGATAFSWDGEVAEVSDDASTFAQPAVPAHLAQGFVPFSIVIGMDYPNFAGDVGKLMAEGKDDLESVAFVTGTGSDQPTGITVAMTGAGNEVDSATTDVFAIADVYTVFETLGPKYRARGTWLGNIAALSDIRQFGTADSFSFSGQLTDAIGGNILNKPIMEASAMDGVITALADNKYLVFGDFSNYVIADRAGFRMELVPHLFATANNLPDAQRGFYGYWRTGGDSINDAAFVQLDVT